MRSVGLVLLAAGSSSRLGRPKQLLEFEGEPLLRRAARVALASGCRPVLVVLGCGLSALRPALDGLPVSIVEHPGWAAGMGGSLRRGVEALEVASPETDGVVVMLCDQPGVRAAHLDALAARAASSGLPLVASRYAGALGVPAFFARSVFAELASLGAGEGARAVLRRDPARVAEVSLEGGEVDIDTEDDYARLTAAPARQPGPA